MGQHREQGAEADAAQKAVASGLEISVREQQRPQKEGQAEEVADVEGVPGDGMMHRGRGIDGCQGQSQAGG